MSKNTGPVFDNEGTGSHTYATSITQAVSDGARDSFSSEPCLSSSRDMSVFPQNLPPSQVDMLLARVGYNEDDRYSTISRASSRPIEESSRKGPFYVPPELSLTNAQEGDLQSTTVLNYYVHEQLTCIRPSNDLAVHRQGVTGILLDILHQTSSRLFANMPDVHVLFDVTAEETLRMYTTDSSIDILIRVCPRELAEEEVTSTLKLQCAASLQAYTQERPILFEWGAYDEQLQQWARVRPSQLPRVSPEAFLYTIAKSLRNALFVDPVCTVRNAGNSHCAHLRISPGCIRGFSAPAISIEIASYPHMRESKLSSPSLKFLHLQPQAGRVMSSVFTMAPFLQPVLLILHKHLSLCKLDEVYTGGVSLYYLFLLLLRYVCMQQDATGAICRNAANAVLGINIQSITKPNLSKHSPTSSYLCNAQGHAVHHPSLTIDQGLLLTGFLYCYVYATPHHQTKRQSLEDARACRHFCYVSKLRAELPNVYVATPYLPVANEHKFIDLNACSNPIPSNVQLCIKDPITQGMLGQKSFKIRDVLEAWSDLYALLLTDSLKTTEASPNTMSPHAMLLFITGKTTSVLPACCRAHQLSSLLGATGFDNRLPAVSQNLPKYPMLHKTSSISTSTLFNLLHLKYSPQQFLGRSNREKVAALASQEYYPIEPLLLHSPADCSCALCLGISSSSYLRQMKLQLGSYLQLDLLRDPRIGIPCHLPCPTPSYPLIQLFQSPQSPLLFFPYQNNLQVTSPIIILPPQYANFKAHQPPFRKHTCTSVVMILTVIPPEHPEQSHCKPTNLSFIVKNDHAAYMYNTAYAPILLDGTAPELPTGGLPAILPPCICGGLFLKVSTSLDSSSGAISKPEIVSVPSNQSEERLSVVECTLSTGETSQHADVSSNHTSSFDDTLSSSSQYSSFGRNSNSIQLSTSSQHSDTLSVAPLLFTSFDNCDKVLPLLTNLYNSPYLQAQMADIIVSTPIQTQNPHICDDHCRNVQNRLLGLLIMDTANSEKPRHTRNNSYNDQSVQNRGRIHRRGSSSRRTDHSNYSSRKSSQSNSQSNSQSSSRSNSRNSTNKANETYITAQPIENSRSEKISPSRRFLTVHQSKPRHPRERALSEDGNTPHRWTSLNNVQQQPDISSSNSSSNLNATKTHDDDDETSVLSIYIPPEFFYKE